MKNQRWEDKDILIKMGVLSIEWARYCFPLTTNGFCSNSEEQKITFPYQLVFVFTPYFIWAILSVNATKRWGLRKEKQKDLLSIEESTNLHNMMYSVAISDTKY